MNTQDQNTDFLLIPHSPLNLRGDETVTDVPPMVREGEATSDAPLKVRGGQGGYGWYRVCGANEIPVKEGRRVEFKGYEIALFNLGDEFYATDNRCPHKQGPLADGIVAGKSVFCPLHGWKIDLKTGCARSGGEGQIKTYPVKVVNGNVYVAFEDGSLFKEPL